MLQEPNRFELRRVLVAARGRTWKAARRRGGEVRAELGAAVDAVLAD